MSQYSIKELEKLSGIKAHTIRIWEKRYHLVNPKRTSTNIRLYSDEDLKKILNISVLNKKGLKISKIAGLQKDELVKLVKTLINKTVGFETQIEKLTVTMVELEETEFNKLISTYILQIGFEETILRVVYPFLERIGLMWQTGSINPGREHFIINLVRQKIVTAIDEIIPIKNINQKKFILFLPEGEFHEIALLFMNYLIRKRGHKVIYLGQSIQLNDVNSIHDTFHADYFVTYYTSPIRFEQMRNQVYEMSRISIGSLVLIAGHQTEWIEKINKKNIVRLKDLHHLIKLMEVA